MNHIELINSINLHYKQFILEFLKNIILIVNQDKKISMYTHIQSYVNTFIKKYSTYETNKKHD